MNQLLRLLMQYAQRAGNTLAPKRVGVHHTLYGQGFPDNVYHPFWASQTVRPSVAETGRFGTTAADQIPGMAYYWDAAGQGGASAAARQAQGQTALLFERNMLNPATQGVGKVVTTPRFSTMQDANIPGTRGRMVEGPALRVVDEVAAAAGPLNPADAALLQSLVQRQKLIEASKSTAKVAATGGTAGAFAASPPGFFRSVGSAFISDPATNVQRMEEQRQAGELRGAAGTYVGTLAQGPMGMAISAGLAPEPTPRPAPAPKPAPTRGQQADSARLTAMAQAYQQPKTSPTPLMAVVSQQKKPQPTRLSEAEIRNLLR